MLGFGGWPLRTGTGEGRVERRDHWHPFRERTSLIDDDESREPAHPMSRRRRRNRSRALAPLRPAPSARALAVPSCGPESTFRVRVCLSYARSVFSARRRLPTCTATAPLDFVRVGEQALRPGQYPLWNPYVSIGDARLFARGALHPLIDPPTGRSRASRRSCRCRASRGAACTTSSRGLGRSCLERTGANVPRRSSPVPPFMATPNMGANGAHAALAARWSTRHLRGDLLTSGAIWRKDRRGPTRPTGALPRRLPALRGPAHQDRVLRLGLSHGTSPCRCFEVR